MVLATDILQRVPGLTHSLAYIPYLYSCCRAVATLIHKPTQVKSITSAGTVKLDTYNTNDPFAAFNDLLFDNNNNDDRENDTSTDSNDRISHVDDKDNSSTTNADSNSFGETLARDQNWLAGFPPPDSLSTLVSPLPDSFSTSSWTRNYGNFDHIASSGDLANGNYCTDGEIQHPLWLSTSPPKSAAQLHYPQITLPQSQPQQDKQAGWLQQRQQQPQHQQQQQQQQQQQPSWQIGRQPQQQQQWLQEIGVEPSISENGANMWDESWLN